MHRIIFTSSNLACSIFFFFSMLGFSLHGQVIEEEDTSPPDMIEEPADVYYNSWANYSKAGLWVVPLKTPFITSPYYSLRYQPKSNTGRMGNSIAEWSYVNKAGVNADVLSPDGFIVEANSEGLYGLKSQRKEDFIIPAKYRQLEYLTRDILVGWIGDHSEIWNTEGEMINRIKYGFREGQAPRFTVNLPAIQRGGNELQVDGKSGREGLGFMGPYARDQDFLAISQLAYYDNFMPETRFLGLYKVANHAKVKVLSNKGSRDGGLIPPIQLKDSSLVDSLFLILIEHEGEYQLLANQGRQLFRQLPFTFPSKGKQKGRFKGRHMGRVGPLYPSIYYEYETPKLSFSDETISLSLSFIEHQVDHAQKRAFSYELTGKKSDYHERLTLVSGSYRNKTTTAIYQYLKGNSVALINARGNTLIPAGTYKNFMVAKGYTVLGETLDGQIKLLDHRGRNISKTRFMQANKLKVKPGIHRLTASQSGGGMLYRDSLEFIGPFLPRYDIVFLTKDQPFFVNKDLEYSLKFDVEQNKITDTIPGILAALNPQYPAYIPFKMNNKEGFYRSDFTVLIPPLYQRVALNLSYKPKEVHFTFNLDSQTGIMNEEGEIIRGPLAGSLPTRLKSTLYLQRKEGKQYLLDSLWNPIVDRGFEKFPLRYSLANSDIQYLPFEEGGKYGILDMAGSILDEAVHDTLISNPVLLNQFYGIGKAGELQLIAAMKGYKYPNLYKNIYTFAAYTRIQELPRSYQRNARQKLKSWILGVLEDKEGKIQFLLSDGRIVEGSDLE